MDFFLKRCHKPVSACSTVFSCNIRYKDWEKTCPKGVFLKKIIPVFWQKKCDGLTDFLIYLSDSISVCMQMYTSVYKWVQVQVCTSVCKCVWMWMWMCVCVCMCVCGGGCLCACVCVRVCVCVMWNLILYQKVKWSAVGRPWSSILKENQWKFII